MAIRSEELRIGNWVNFIRVPVKMSAINWEEWGELRPYFEYSSWPYYTTTFENIHPIPLTPDILIACGFMKGESWFVHQIYYQDFIDICCTRKNQFSYGEPIYGPVKVQGFNQKGILLKSLHQLQNLFFSLTGKELEYKPK